MRYAPSVAVLIVAAGFSSVALLSGSAGAVQSDAAANGEQTKSPADLAYEPLGRDVKNLHRSLSNKGGIAAEDHDVIRAVRDRAAVFSRQFPDDIRGPAVELMLSKWLGDDDLVEDLFARILRIDPDRTDVRVSWARMLKEENRYRDALDALGDATLDPTKSPTDVLMRAQCLYAEHRFEQAQEALDSLDTAALQGNPQISGELTQLKQSASEYVSLWEQEQAIRERDEAAGDLPRALIMTSRGPINVELFENEAPNTVANFISLIEKGFYNTTKFHRVISGFMAQGGDPNSKPNGEGIPGQGNPGYFIPDEHIRDDRRNHFTGSLAMAKTDAPNSAGCQFYITVQPTGHLNGKHTVFGRVIEGLDVARSLKQDDVIELVTVLRKRDHEYQPSTLPLVSEVAPVADDAAARDVVSPVVDLAVPNEDAEESPAPATEEPEDSPAPETEEPEDTADSPE